MSEPIASAGSCEPPVSGWLGEKTATDSLAPSAVITLVLWLGCATVGVLGLLIPYPQPRPALAALPPVQAQIVNVELAEVRLSPPEAPPPPMLLLPPPAPSPAVIARAKPFVAVAVPSPAIAFAVPVEGPARVVAPPQAAYASPAMPAVTPSASPVKAQRAPPLTLGPGEGRQPAPEYPREAVRAGQKGTVRIGFTVGEDGRVQAAEIADPCPWPLLNEAALRTVRRNWRFPPGPVRRYEVPIRFQLEK